MSTHRIHKPQFLGVHVKNGKRIYRKFSTEAGAKKFSWTGEIS